MDINLQLDDKLKSLPLSPGVYLFKNHRNRVIYVGKAKILRNRVRSYFQEGSQNDRRITELIQHIVDLHWIVTLSETDALILEDQLIKLHSPKYNIQLKDDKSYPYIKISKQEKFPRLFLTRKIEEDGADYYGPYSSVFDARLTLQVIHKFFPLRTSKMNLDDGKIYRPCLNFHLKRCLAPCRGNVSIAEYAKVLSLVQRLLSGDYQNLISDLKTAMYNKSQMLNFEAAAVVRDQIKAVETTLKRKPRIKGLKMSCDVFAILRKDGFIGVQLLFVRQGVIVGSDFYLLKNVDFQSDEEVLRSLFSKIYLGSPQSPPHLIFAPMVSPELKIFEDYIKLKKDISLKVSQPDSRHAAKLYQLALDNGRSNIEVYLATDKSVANILEQSKLDLDLKNVPHRVECFDISNLSGSNNVASMVVYEDNCPVKKDYKKYKIKSVQSIDDYAAMAEVIVRRLKRQMTSNWRLPDLLIIDGGLGHLHVVAEAIKKEFNTKFSFDLIALAKGRSAKKKGIMTDGYDFEYVLKMDQEDPITLKKGSTTLHFLQRIRDEAHRFAKLYHSNLRTKSLLHSGLEDIKGIGKVKKKRLLLSLGGISGLKHSTIEQLKAVPGISAKDAQQVYKYFHN